MTEVNEVTIARGGAMAEGGGGGRGKLIKILLAVIVLAGVVAGGWYGVNKFWPGGGQPEDRLAKNGDNGANQANTGLRPGPLKNIDDPTGYVEDPQYLELGDFTVLLTGGRRYLKVNIQIVLGNSASKNFLETRLADVRALVLTKLQTQSYEEMKTERARAILISELRTRIISLFPPDQDDWDWDIKLPIKKVLFTEFYMQ